MAESELWYDPEKVRPFFHEESRQASKETFFGLIGYKPHTDEVRRYHKSDAALRIASAPARSSKSYSASPDHTHDFFPERCRKTMKPVLLEGLDAHRVWYVGANYEPLKEWDYAWKTLIDDGLVEAAGGTIEAAHNRPSNGALQIKVNWGQAPNGDVVRSILEGKSATNEKSIQSEEVKSGILAETKDHEARIWDKYLSTRVRRCTWPTTPRAEADWIKKVIDEAEGGNLPGTEVFQFTPYCNPTFKWSSYWNEHAKAESRVLGKIITQSFGHDCFDPAADCHARKDNSFAEQWMGEWTMEAGRVLPFRWKSRHGEMCHVINYLPEWFGYARKFVAVDYGYNDPSGAYWYAVGPDGTVVAYREIYESKLWPDQLVERIHDLSERHGEHIEYYVGDPRKPEVARYFREKGLPIWNGDKNAMSDRASGHARLVDYLSIDPAVGRPKFFVLATDVDPDRLPAPLEGKPSYGCPKGIAEWRALRRKSGVIADEFSDAAMVGRDEFYDTTRYFLASRPGNTSEPTLSREFLADFEPMREYDYWASQPAANLSARTPLRSF